MDTRGLNFDSHADPSQTNIYVSRPNKSLWTPPSDAAGHLQRREALPARLGARLRQTETVLCGVRWWRGPRLWRRLGHTHAGWARRRQPGPEGVAQLDLGVHPQTASCTSLLITRHDPSDDKRQHSVFNHISTSISLYHVCRDCLWSPHLCTNVLFFYIWKTTGLYLVWVGCRRRPPVEQLIFTQI